MVFTFELGTASRLGDGESRGVDATVGQATYGTISARRIDSLEFFVEPVVGRVPTV